MRRLRRTRHRHREVPEMQNPGAGATATGADAEKTSRGAQDGRYQGRMTRAIVFYTIDANLVVQAIAFMGVRS